MLASMAGTCLVRPVWADIDSAIIKKHDETVENLLTKQVTEAQSRWRGGYPDRHGLVHAGSAGGIIEIFTAAFLNEQSGFYKNSLLFERIKLAAEFLQRGQSPQGNIDLLTTNFNSPPDTGFVVHHVGATANLAKTYGERELLKVMEPFLRNAGKGMAEGGIHTPNHRWVVCSALAQIDEVFPNPAYVRRIDQWLAEGIDIDADGQFLERSTTVYNAVTDHALVVMAYKLKRPELLEPVRRNLDSMLYLLHPNYEVVTEISRRQDLNTRGTMERYWFPLRYLAIKDENGQYADIVQQLEPETIRLALLMEYSELQKTLPEAVSVPDDYEKEYKEAGITRIRRGRTSATLIHAGNSRFFSLRCGNVVIDSVRFASAFFGKGQFVPQRMEKQENSYHFYQSMDAGYYQPLDPPHVLESGAGAWSAARGQRRRTEICRMDYGAVVKEIPNGFELRIHARGTDSVPLAVEINLREGGKLRGCEPLADGKDGFLLKNGFATYRVGEDVIRFGPGMGEHEYTQVRGAEEKPAGICVYLTGWTPLEMTVVFECSR